MSWQAIQAAAAVQSTSADFSAAAIGAHAGAAASPAESFGQMVSQGIGEVNQQLQASQTLLQQLAVGDVQNLHQVMISMEESRLSFQMLLQVRNRLLEAYQDVMKMQI